MEKLEATLRIPCPEQYAFIEVKFTGTPEEIVEEYRNLTKLHKQDSGQEMGAKE